jgi:hypothetical protein
MPWRNPVRVDEQIVELERTAGVHRRGEPDHAAVGDRDSNVARPDIGVREVEQLGMGHEVDPVARVSTATTVGRWRRPRSRSASVASADLGNEHDASQLARTADPDFSSASSAGESGPRPAGRGRTWRAHARVLVAS